MYDSSPSNYHCASARLGPARGQALRGGSIAGLRETLWQEIGALRSWTLVLFDDARMAAQMRIVGSASKLQAIEWESASNE